MFYFSCIKIFWEKLTSFNYNFICSIKAQNYWKMNFLWEKSGIKYPWDLLLLSIAILENIKLFFHVFNCIKFFSEKLMLFNYNFIYALSKSKIIGK